MTTDAKAPSRSRPPGLIDRHKAGNAAEVAGAAGILPGACSPVSVDPRPLVAGAVAFTPASPPGAGGGRPSADPPPPSWTNLPAARKPAGTGPAMTTKGIPPVAGSVAHALERALAAPGGHRDTVPRLGDSPATHSSRATGSQVPGRPAPVTPPVPADTQAPLVAARELAFLRFAALPTPAAVHPEAAQRVAARMRAQVTTTPAPGSTAAARESAAEVVPLKGAEVLGAGSALRGARGAPAADSGSGEGSHSRREAPLPTGAAEAADPVARGIASTPSTGGPGAATALAAARPRDASLRGADADGETTAASGSAHPVEQQFQARRMPMLERLAMPLPLPQRDWSGLLEQVRGRLEILSLDAGGRAEISLEPEELGSLRLLLERGAQGWRLEIRAGVETTARELLRQAQDLHVQLSKAGVRLEELRLLVETPPHRANALEAPREALRDPWPGDGQGHAQGNGREDGDRGADGIPAAADEQAEEFSSRLMSLLRGTGPKGDRP